MQKTCNAAAFITAGRDGPAAPAPLCVYVCVQHNVFYECSVALQGLCCLDIQGMLPRHTGPFASTYRASLIDLLHLGALVAVLLERRQLLDVRSGSSSSSIERLSLIMRWMRPAKVAGSSSEKPEVSSEVSKSRWTKSLTVLSPLSAATLDLSSCPDTN